MGDKCSKEEKKAITEATSVEVSRRGKKEGYLLDHSVSREDEVEKSVVRSSEVTSLMRDYLDLVEISHEPSLLSQYFASLADIFGNTLGLDSLADVKSSAFLNRNSLMINVLTISVSRLDALKAVEEVIKRRGASVSTFVGGWLEGGLIRYSIGADKSLDIIDKPSVAALVSRILSSLKNLLHRVRSEAPLAEAINELSGADALSDIENTWVIRSDLLRFSVTDLVSNHLFMEEVFMDPFIRIYERLMMKSNGFPLLEKILGAVDKVCQQVISPEGSKEVICERLGRATLPRGFSQFSGEVPIVVLHDNGFWTCLVAYVLLRMLKEVVGGQASVEVWGPLTIDLAAHGAHRIRDLGIVNAITDLKLQRITYSGRVHVFYLGSADSDKREDKRVESFLGLLKNILLSLFSKGPGFVLVVATRDEEFSELCQKLMNGYCGLSRVICLDPSSQYIWSTKTDVNKAVSLAEAVVSEYLILGAPVGKPDNHESWVKKLLPGISPCLPSREPYIFRNSLIEELYVLSPFVEMQGNESTGFDRHQYSLKLLTFKAILDRLLATYKGRSDMDESLDQLLKWVRELINSGRLGVERIPWIGEDHGVIPDIAFINADGKRVCVEIETLIGSEEPAKKIDATIRKYVGRDICDEIWVTTEPVTAVIHYEEFKYRLKYKDIIYDKLSSDLKFKVISIWTHTKTAEGPQNTSSPTKSMFLEQIVLLDLNKFIHNLRESINELDPR